MDHNFSFLIYRDGQDANLFGLSEHAGIHWNPKDGIAYVDKESEIVPDSVVGCIVACRLESQNEKEAWQHYLLKQASRTIQIGHACLLSERDGTQCQGTCLRSLPEVADFVESVAEFERMKSFSVQFKTSQTAPPKEAMKSHWFPLVNRYLYAAHFPVPNKFGIATWFVAEFGDKTDDDKKKGTLTSGHPFILLDKSQFAFKQLDDIIQNGFAKNLDTLRKKNVALTDWIIVTQDGRFTFKADYNPEVDTASTSLIVLNELQVDPMWCIQSGLQIIEGVEKEFEELNIKPRPLGVYQKFATFIATPSKKKGAEKNTGILTLPENALDGDFSERLKAAFNAWQGVYGKYILAPAFFLPVAHLQRTKLSPALCRVFMPMLLTQSTRGVTVDVRWTPDLSTTKDVLQDYLTQAAFPKAFIGKVYGIDDRMQRKFLVKLGFTVEIENSHSVNDGVTLNNVNLKGEEMLKLILDLYQNQFKFTKEK